MIKLDPGTGIRLILDAQRAEDRRSRRRINLDMEFAEEGGEGPTPYEVLLHAAMIGQSTRFTRQDSVEQSWRILQPLLDSPPPVHPYAKGTWGPEEADELVAGYGSLARAPGSLSERRQVSRARQRRRRSRRSPTTRSSPTATPAR